MRMIKEHNSEINQILTDFIEKLEKKIKEHKDNFKDKTMKNIFSSLNYAKEKMSENSVMFNVGYDSTKIMVSEYKKALDERYVSWKECDSDKYEIEFIEKIYDLLDNILPSIENIKTRDTIKDVAIDDLCKHLDILYDYAKEHDSYFSDSNDDTDNDKDMNLNIQIYGC